MFILHHLQQLNRVLKSGEEGHKEEEKLGINELFNPFCVIEIRLKNYNMFLLLISLCDISMLII